MITQKQRDAYRFALEDKGMPEVLAFMAAENLGSRFSAACLLQSDLSGLVLAGFFWDDGKEPFDFWEEIYDSCKPA